MDETKYANDFEIIALAGDSRSKMIKALREAKSGKYAEAEKLMTDAESEMNSAHTKQFEMLQKEANGEHVDVNIVTVHAQDHLTMATVTHDLVVEIIDILKQK